MSFFYRIRFVNSTGCLILEKGFSYYKESESIDYQFINNFKLSYMTFEELEKEAQQLANKHNIESYVLDFMEHEAA